MKKKMLSLCLVFTMLCSAIPLTQAADTTLNPTKVYAAYVPELSTLTEEHLSQLPYADVSILFEDVFSVGAENFTEELVRTSLKNLAAFYRYNNSKTDANKITTGTKAASTNSSLSSYTGSIGVYFERDYNKSPLNLNEVSSNWWTVGVGYITYNQALIVAAGLDKTIFNMVVSFVAGKVTEPALKAALAAYFGLSGWPLAVTVTAAELAITIVTGLDSMAELRALQTETLKGDKNDLTRVTYEWIGSSVLKTYKSTSVTTTYTATTGYTYKNIPNPTGNYGFWTKDEFGPF